MQPRVGVGVFIFREGKFLMQKRQGSHGEGTWSVPGGHLEYGETQEQTAAREVKEETGLDIVDIRFGAVTNDIFESDNKHYLTVWMLSEWSSGEPVIAEPEKCTEQGWFDFDSLPEPLFLPWQQLLPSDFMPTLHKELEKSKSDA